MCLLYIIYIKYLTFSLFIQSPFKSDIYLKRRLTTKTAQYLLKGLSHFQTAAGVDEGVNHRVAHNEDQVHGEVRHVAETEWMVRTGHQQNEVEEKRCPAAHKHAEEDGDGYGSLHTAALTWCRVPGGCWG